jgi:hypothetical protein
MGIKFNQHEQNNKNTQQFDRYLSRKEIMWENQACMGG